ncbi:hypothetical protein AbraIFM66951_011037 [Aspergillus brasiliensis]|uniref:Altered inheritance of mitochondria protein 9, mitochondrial n=1 Tax=Aspergillus brasiliensis TaxID=319629 RepID=A0A9W5YLV6_9EURO|nr:hypothetical protein AbraCBS73388_003898 [Aspergillus brasiliensis]GKZ41756.1 hypothetical protein AbraIFM66951_011037 [Aspergillus brasiliensis]
MLSSFNSHWAVPDKSQIILHLSFDPHNYTSGRWLRDDKKERASRYIECDFDVLCRRILDLSPKASSIIDCQKVEGGFNRVFVFELNDDTRLVAKLPFALAGPPRLTTSSEVATIKYYWNDDATSIENAIGSEYIIMEHAAGVQLHNQWHGMTDKQRVKCIDAIYRKLKEVVDLQFPCFGSMRLMETSALDHIVEPDTGTVHLHMIEDPIRGLVRGADLQQYCDGLVDAGLSRLPAVEPKMKRRPVYHGSIETHKILLGHTRSLLRSMSQDSRIKNCAIPALFHPDLHKRNIFVSEDDPSVITGIIDWQAASIEPAFWYADEIPDFATENEVCTRAFDVCTQFLTPRLSNPRLLDQNLFRPFRYSYRTWKDGAVALQHDLIDTSHNWERLGFAGRCPYSLPPPHALADHRKQYRLFEAAHNLRYDLAGLLNTATDGWVPVSDWQTTQTAHHEMFDGMLQAVLTNPEADDPDEPVKDEETLRSIWPFDI